MHGSGLFSEGLFSGPSSLTGHRRQGCEHFEATKNFSLHVAKKAMTRSYFIPMYSCRSEHVNGKIVALCFAQTNAPIVRYKILQIGKTAILLSEHAFSLQKPYFIQNETFWMIMISMEILKNVQGIYSFVVKTYIANFT